MTLLENRILFNIEAVTLSSISTAAAITTSDSNRAGEGVQGISKQRVVRRDEAPLVLPNVIHFARHIIIAADDIYFVLEEEGFVADAQLVH